MTPKPKVAPKSRHRKPKTKPLPQFEAVARELGCPEDEEALDHALKQIAEAGPVPKHQPKKRTPKNQSRN